MMRFTFIITTFLITYSSGINAQAISCVGNKNYQKMINALISYSVPTMTCSELMSHYSEYIILDAREKEEYQISHLPNAIHVGFDSFLSENISHLSKNQKIVCYCSVGYRSEKIAEKLIQLGYTNIHNLCGSSFEWANKGYPLVNLQKDTVKTIHAYSRLWGRWMQNKEIKKVY